MGEFERIAEERPLGDGRRVHRALVIGIDRYDDAALRMQFCSEPAAAMARLLAARGYQVTQLHDHPGSDGRATLARVERALAAMMKAADEDDTILFYFGGHGVLVGERPVLLAADARRRGSRYVAGTLPVSRLLARLRGRPRWTVVLLDACHMGLTLDPSSSRSTAAVRERAGGFALLSGSTSDDVTQDSVAGGGAFTLGLLDGLAGAAADPDGGVRFSSLARHVQEWIEAWKTTDEARLIGARQTPVLRLEVADVQVLPSQKFRDLAPPPAAKITCAAFSPDGRRLVTGGEDRAVRIWDAETCTPIQPPVAHAADLAGVSFSPNGLEVASVSQDGVTQVWSLTNVRVHEARRRKRGRVNGVAWSGDSTCRALATDEGLFIDDVAELLHPVGTRKLSRGRQRYWSVAFTAGLFELVSGDDAGNVTSWNQLVGVASEIGKHEGPVWAVATGPDERYVAAGGADVVPSATLHNQPRIWDQETGKAVVLRGHRSAVTGMAFSPDGEWLATSGYDGVVRVFAVAGGRLTRELTVAVAGRRHRPEAYAVCFSPRGDRLFAGYSDGRGRLFDLRT
jgi:WD40 repeat protein